MDWLEFEKEALAKGYKSVCGVDEAGRGPLAGPVCAAAVILPEGVIIDGVNDSKKLSEKKRESLFDVIREQALSYSIAYATVDEIEEINILNATMLAMRRAIDGLDIKADYAMIDGNKIPPIDIDAECDLDDEDIDFSRWLLDQEEDNWGAVRLRVSSPDDLALFDAHQYMLRVPVALAGDDPAVFEQALRRFCGIALYDGTSDFDAEFLERLHRKYGLIIL